MSAFSLRGRVALVTGGSKGIGAGIALALAGAGADVAILGRDEQGLSRVREQIEATGVRATAVTADVSDAGEVADAVSAVGAELGPPGVLINNAGVVKPVELLDLDEADWDRIVDTNLKGCFLMARAVVEPMIEAGGGKIVNISSIFAGKVRPKMAPYAASKGGLTQLTKVMALEWASHNVLVNALAPGYVAIERTVNLYRGTDMGRRVAGETPLRRWGQPEDMGGPAVFLASAASDFMTGQTLVVDGGWSIA